MKKISRYLLLVLILQAFFVGCTENDSSDYGKLKISVTDAPFPIDMIDSAVVTIVKVEARLKTDTSDSEFLVLSEDTASFNLLELRNGVSETLGEVDLPVGEYDLVRLYVDEASLTIKDGETYKVKVPSGAQTGIKVFIDPSVVVSGGLTSELLLDFNLEKSFVLKGNMNTPAGIKGFNFKPVIRAVNNSEAGRLLGVVTDTSGNVIENASVWVNQDTLVASAMTEADGSYVIPGLPAGTYSAAAYFENFDTLVVENVDITAANAENVDFELTSTAVETE